MLRFTMFNLSIQLTCYSYLMKQDILYNKEDQSISTPSASSDSYSQEAAQADKKDENISASSLREYNVEEEGNFFSSLRIFGLILISPLEGWKAVRRHNISFNSWAQSCFYPLIAFSAVSIFFTKFYNPYSSIEELLIPAVARFISYFFGYFLISLLCQIFLPHSSKILTDSNFGKIFMMTILSSLASFAALISLLPMLEPVLVFLPLWSTYLIYKGVRFLKLPEQHQAWTVIILSIFLIGVPYILNWSFNLIL